MAIAIIMENARVYCCQGILNCHMTFAGSVISLARPESWPRIAMISKKLAIVTIRISATPPSKKNTYGSRDYQCVCICMCVHAM